MHARIRSNNEAELETTITDGVLKVSQRQNGGNGQHGDWFQPSSSLDVILIVPAGWDLPVTARTGKGDVSSDGVQGLREVHTGKGDVSTSASARDLAIHTGMGDVSVRNGRGAVAVDTGKGDVSISELAGGLQVRTGSGDVSVHDWQAPAATNGGGKHAIRTGAGDVSISRAQAPSLEVHTGRGDCAFDKITVADLRVQSGSGDVALNGDPDTGKWDVRTGKGDLSVRIPARAARIEAFTRHGDISSDLPQVKAARPGPGQPARRSFHQRDGRRAARRDPARDGPWRHQRAPGRRAASGAGDHRMDSCDCRACAGCTGDRGCPRSLPRRIRKRPPLPFWRACRAANSTWPRPRRCCARSSRHEPNSHPPIDISSNHAKKPPSA